MTTKNKPARRHLGRGLESLLSPVTAPDENQSTQQAASTVGFIPDKQLRESIRHIPIERAKPNPYQPRTTWDPQELHDLAESIRTNGIIQPILVRQVQDGYEVIAGERRLRAAKEAGLETIPAMVRDADDAAMLELALVENIHRSDLNPVERATAYKNFIESLSLTQAQAAERLGQDRSVIANYLRLLDLPQDVRQMLIDRKLTMGHARAILALPTDQLRRTLANRALAGRLSVRQVEQLVRRSLDGPAESRAVKEKSAHIADLENRLRESLGTKVIINSRKNGRQGRIIIEFYSLDEFDRLTEKMGLDVVDTV